MQIIIQYANKLFKIYISPNGKAYISPCGIVSRPKMVGNPDLEGVLTQMSLNSMWLKEIGKKEVELPKVFIDGYTGVSISMVRNFVYCKSEKVGDYILKEGCFKIRNGELKLVEGIFYIPNTMINPIGSRKRGWYNYSTTEDLINNELEKVEKRVEKILNKERWLIKVEGDDIKIYVNVKKGKERMYDLIGQQGELRIMRVPPITFEPMGYQIVKTISLNSHRVDFEYEVVRFQLFSFGGLAEIVYPLNGTTEAVVKGLGHEELTLKLYPSYLYLFTYPSH